MSQVFWFRRDLRLQDNLALNQAITEAIEDGSREVTLAYLLDVKKFASLSPIRQHSLNASVESLNASVHNKLVIRHGESNADLAIQLIELAQSSKALSVHATRAFDPHGVEQQNTIGLASV